MNIINNLQELDLDLIIKNIDNSKKPDDALEILKSIPMIGAFLACEIWTDLAYINFFKQR